MLLMKYFIGLDIHSKSSTFAVVDQEGQCVLRKEVPTTEKSMESVINQING
jgi:predicted NBD/HSP70 family sugar kinase